MGQFGLSWLAIDLCTFLTRHALPIDPMNAPYPSKFVDGSRLWQRLEALAHWRYAFRRRIATGAVASGVCGASTAAELGAGCRPGGRKRSSRELVLPAARPSPKRRARSHRLLSRQSAQWRQILGKLRNAGSSGSAGCSRGIRGDAAPADRRSALDERRGDTFSPGYMGSATFAGECPLHRILDVHDRDGVSVAPALSHLSATFAEVPRIALGFPCAAYLEAHLEQGPTLDDSGCQIGIVTAMQGVRRYSVHVEGEAAHAGSMPRHRRRDALSATVRIISSLEDFYAAPDVTFTVGQLSVEPNAPSVVPRETRFSIDIRHRDNLVLARLGEAIRLVCESEKKPCAATMTDLEISPSVEFDAGLQQVMRTCAERLGLTQMPLVSLGGHDAKSLVGHVPAASCSSRATAVSATARRKASMPPVL